jgi:hypothetical protein
MCAYDQNTYLCTFQVLQEYLVLKKGVFMVNFAMLSVSQTTDHLCGVVVRVSS